jgi:ribosomal-protein-alanine N-acetyltransferase
MEQLFETARLRVREYQESDIASIQEYASQPAVVQYANWGPNTLAETRYFFLETQASKAQSPRLIYALSIERKEDGRQIGGCELDIDPNAAQEAAIGYILHPHYWNKGYGTEVTQGLIAFAKQKVAISLIRATCDIRNVASRRVLEKSGFVLECVLRNDFFKRGEIRTTMIFAHRKYLSELA